MVIWLLVLTLVCVATCNNLVVGEEKTCLLDNRRYQIGETWHPILQPLGAMLCVNCTCQQGGKVECVSEYCPRPDCPVPEHLPDKCCPICKDHIEEDDVTDEPLPGCEFNGADYEDGEVFPSNKTGIKPTRRNQCVMCVCSMGYLLCHLKTCLPVKCKKLIRTDDDCCPSCEGMAYTDEMEYEDYFDSILSDPTPKNMTQADCRAMGYKENSSSWHPVVGIFGEMKCITCRCLNGKVECGRETCPSADKLPCKKPKIVPGECCKSCPNRRKKKNRDSKKGKRNKKGKDTERRKNGRKKGRKKKRKKGSSTPSSIEPGSSGKIQVFPCLPRKTDRFVYFSEKIDSVILAFSLIKEKQVEVTEWSVKKGRLSNMQMQSMSTTDFLNKYPFLYVVGATNKRRYKKMKKKLRKKLSRCKNKCRKKVVITVVKRLKTKNVTYSATCDNKL